MAKVTTIKKAAKKKKMSKQDEKQIKDFEEREKAEKGYDEDSIRYGMKESVFDARPKQKTEVEVMARTGHKGTQYSYDMRGRRLGPENPVNREFARIRIGDTELAKKEAAAKKPSLKEELIQVLEARKAGAKPKDEDGPCWSGYTQYGMKTKRGRSVPNCVKDK